MNCKSFVEEKSKLMNKKLSFQRWFYSIIGLITISGIVLLTLEQIRHMKKENHEFAFCLLLYWISLNCFIHFLYINIHD
jgi:FtsH-binding integral membrane protein